MSFGERTRPGLGASDLGLLHRSRYGEVTASRIPFSHYESCGVGLRAGNLKHEYSGQPSLASLKVGLTEHHCYEVTDRPQYSPFQTDPSTACSLDDTTVRGDAVLRTAFSAGDEELSHANLHILDAQVPEMEVDSREGSPCRQAAAELLDPADSDFPPATSGSAESLGLQPSLSQAFVERMIPQGVLEATKPIGSSYASQGVEAVCSHRVPQSAPHPASQPDWITTMMDQAQSVGLWGGMTADKHPLRAPSPPSGLPILPEPLLSKASRGTEERALENGSLAFYESGVNAMLASKPCEETRARPHPAASIVPRPGLSHQMPRLPPVSLGMTGPVPQAAFAWTQHSGGRNTSHLENDGPFRPPTRPLDQGRSWEPEMHHPMLQQSKLQLSLGLAADKPLDLKDWGYGSKSADDALCRERKGPSGTKSCQAYNGPALQARQTLLHSVKSSTSLESADPPSLLVSSAVHQKATTSLHSGPATTFQPKDSLAAAELGSTSQSHEEGSLSRAECLERYREKKRRRLFSKTIRYHKRKVNADKRPRIKGRFVKAASAAANVEDDVSGSEGHEDS